MGGIHMLMEWQLSGGLKLKMTMWEFTPKSLWINLISIPAPWTAVYLTNDVLERMRLVEKQRVNKQADTTP